ncbi:2-succinyl-5-enolpyruvyl-6-hydroxy-3-cyclohexene-1-carboxylic-acid synthase [Bacillus luteolus]|uniref:2-succinyl-5-enolpyruvyl-6-hydroxy-3-cyclohexene-1-carboxylate synthase n=1 Tax=Litchfieldia luteola TaxID=682179 RepID=A0ABR9QIS9_9BACI|nr:2-succinyl-5-enolpyruvyl-6-hydroxy-3-cyclohexene-1-carboxylic-acid synthase [Cytobacillus luteolus]MBE4908408.1 2-succinyl-5-enolpyruvyl-6-hydroxy-3-cyclohexene-1-carboxylic-acid synthase [Cytobacillus luteolus]MBP1943196.1 2-succinyl-5-enolpyruvyl-6-hydroxy-3-cyclohexene-1-carboxylate synthase [Cytobacillus luteolus]
MNENNALTTYVASFIDELVRVGVTTAVISPGSRSTPMAILMAEHSNMDVYVNIDERSAAFFALGIAKEKKTPVAILCTSGTAAANYYPAIVEASISRVPLLVLTADRPHELRDVGAPQAIDQIHMYGKYAKWFVEMALPEDTNEMIKYARTMAARATGKSLTAPAGPVHLNFPFREPLIPNIDADSLWNKGTFNNPKHVNVSIGRPVIDESLKSYLFELLSSYEKGVIICGEQVSEEFSEYITKVASLFGFPILADPLSQLRSGSHSKEYIIDCYDTFLRNQDFTKTYQPDIIIRFGAMPISKALLQYVKANEGCKQIVIDSDGGWREPTLSASEMVYCDEIKFCEAMLALGQNKDIAKTNWTNDWILINEITMSELMSIQKEEVLAEGKVIVELKRLLPTNSTLFIGNSMPIRDVDSFFTNTEKALKIMANRGANGIDGTISTALGVSASSSDRLVLVIGDLTFFHDLNGLLAAKKYSIPITIVLINNNGGGIFSFLPQAKEEKHFETLFGTPLDLDFEHVVKMYGGNFTRINTWESFEMELLLADEKQGISVIEVPSVREENVTIHRTLWNRVSQEISNFIIKSDKQ